MMHTKWPWLWFLANGATGLSYLVIAIIIWRERCVRIEYWSLFTMFVAACGLHHLVHTLPWITTGHPGAAFSPFWIDSLQLVADLTMTSLSVIAAAVLWHEHHLRQECQ